MDLRLPSYLQGLNEKEKEKKNIWEKNSSPRYFLLLTEGIVP